MKAPIYDFVKKYAESGQQRLHMPGHKGQGPLGIEHLDITEIEGADSLYEASGIIKESEDNASELFGSETFYSTEGSSLSIRAMIYMLCLYAKNEGRAPVILAARNAHKSLLSAAALTDAELRWIYPEDGGSYLSANVTPDLLDAALEDCDLESKPVAVYITSPDYLGNIADIEGLGKVCKKHGVLLAVDNAHGAYLHFLEKSRHPISLGADICCDSAHKTLPVLGGGGYLHIAANAPRIFSDMAKCALSLFGSTSPSYLILQSLDLANPYLLRLRELLPESVRKIESLKAELKESALHLLGDEPLKITIDARDYGYTGYDLAEILKKNGITAEFADGDFTVLMLPPLITDEELGKIKRALLSVKRRTALKEIEFNYTRPRTAMTVREAMLSPMERIDASHSLGRILASPSVSCPPAVPILICGEVIGDTEIEMFKYYGCHSVLVVKKR